MNISARGNMLQLFPLKKMLNGEINLLCREKVFDKNLFVHKEKEIMEKNISIRGKTADIFKVANLGSAEKLYFMMPRRT